MAFRGASTFIFRSSAELVSSPQTPLLYPLSFPKLTQTLQEKLPGWKASSSHRRCIQRTFVFPSFIQALVFMQRVAPHCEIMNHHPTWTNTYNRVEVELSTHDAGNQVTLKDVELAEIMNRVFLEVPH